MDPGNTTTTAPRRMSRFTEIGLDEHSSDRTGFAHDQRPARTIRFRSKPDGFEFTNGEQSDGDELSDESNETERAKKEQGEAAKLVTHARFQGSSTMYRFATAAMVLAILVPLLQGIPWIGHATVPPMGANGGVIRKERSPIIDVQPDTLVKRANSPTDVCSRWAHQTALVNGTLYIYGGEASTSPGQTEDLWNNNFLTLDLTSTWQISNPSLTGLPQPSGPPNVSLGALWNSYDSLYLYGGEFSSSPPEDPTPFSLWEYDIGQSQWTEHSEPTTSSGESSGPDGAPVQRSAEGAGISVPALGRGWYFGGHQDGYTTSGWSQSIYRIYLESMLEFTFPGYQNSQVYALSDNKTAGIDGNWRNITSGGLQSTAGFPERADGLLLYVPGFGANGILIGLAGGTNTTFQQMNEIDVFDIATSNWYKQATSGPTPEIRVNPCAVVAAAPDGSSYNVHMFGGQSLQPAGNQTQYDDMWILTIPAFTWIKVDTSSQSVPYARAGHTCDIWNGQMVVVGGYVGAELSCDSPGVYVFDLSSLKWVNQYTALIGGSSGGSAPSSTPVAAADESQSSLASNSKTNPFNQQPAQLNNGSDTGGLDGSYGYLVPQAVISVIGGASTGGATITAPAQTATAGPLATGRAVTYTVTGADGSTTTSTNVPDSSASNSSGSSGPNVAAIVAGVIAGVLFIIVCYLAFSAWLYRKRVGIYKRHVEMSQRAHGTGVNEKTPFTAGLAGLTLSDESGSDRRGYDPYKLSSEVSASGSGGRHGSAAGSGHGSGNATGSGSGNEYKRESRDDLLGANEPTFWGTALAPRRSLRVINKD